MTLGITHIKWVFVTMAWCVLGCSWSRWPTDKEHSIAAAWGFSSRK